MDGKEVLAAQHVVAGVRAAFAHSPESPAAYATRNDEEGWSIQSFRRPDTNRTTRVVVNCGNDNVAGMFIPVLNATFTSNWKGDQVTFTDHTP